MPLKEVIQVWVASVRSYRVAIEFLAAWYFVWCFDLLYSIISR